MDSVITPQMHAALGSLINRRASYAVSASDIRRWATAVYWPQPPPERFLAADEALLVAPEEHNPFAWAVVVEQRNPAAISAESNDPDRTEKQLGIQGPGLKRQLNGGVSVTYGTPMRVGDRITSVRTLFDYTEREGRLGHMLFTVTTDTWTNQNDQLVKKSDFTLIRY